MAIHFAIGLAQFALGPAADFPFRFRAKFVANLGWLRWHGTLGALALGLGALQVSGDFRVHWPRLHRAGGLLYTGAVLASAAGALKLAGLAEGGAAAQSAFVTQGILWPVTLGLAWRAILRRDWEAHRRWMLRNYALTFAAVTLRLLLHCLQDRGQDFDRIYPWVAWGSWIFNLALVELGLWLMQRDFLAKSVGHAPPVGRPRSRARSQP